MGDHQDALIKHYSGMYSGKEKHDSPEESRTNICRKIIEIVKLQEIPNPNILDLGSGPQALEKQLLAFGNKEDRNMLKNLSITTLDIASILKNKILALKFGANHVQADSKLLPFSSNSFGLIISNHSIDFIPNRDNAIKEAFRTLSHGGIVIFNFHHKDMLKSISKTSGSVKEHWNYLIDNNLLFGSETEIRNYLKKFGYKDIEIEEKSDNNDKWWMICAKKY